MFNGKFLKDEKKDKVFSNLKKNDCKLNTLELLQVFCKTIIFIISLNLYFF